MHPFVRDITSCLIGPEASIHVAVAAIDRSTIGICLVVDSDRHLLGTLTDGDIRRAMLSGTPFEQSVQTLLARKQDSRYPKPIYGRSGDSDAVLLATMQKHDVQHLPLLDAEQRVVDIALLSRLIPEPPDGISAVVMAGGFGTRLLPLTETTPKPMLPVGDRPLLERTLQQLKLAGIESVSITTHHLHEQISDYFGNGDALGLSLRYVQEDNPLGTAGALRLLEDTKQTRLIINGDVLTTIDYRAMLQFHRDCKAALSVAVRRYAVDVPYGVVEFDGDRVLGLREKPTYTFFVNAGIYLIEPWVCGLIPPDRRFDMTDLISDLIRQEGKVASFPIREYWLDIGRHGDYEQAQKDILEGKLV